MSSEVAQIRQAIEDEARASWAALYALRQGGAEHQVITARMTQYLDDLAGKVGTQAACALVTSFDTDDDAIDAQAQQPHGEGH